MPEVEEGGIGLGNWISPPLYKNMYSTMYVDL